MTAAVPFQERLAREARRDRLLRTAANLHGEAHTCRLAVEVEDYATALQTAQDALHEAQQVVAALTHLAAPARRTRPAETRTA